MLPLVLWEIREERASVILIAPNQPGFPDLTELLEAPPWPILRQEVYAIPGGRLGVALEPGTMEPSCVIVSGVSEEMGALQSRMLARSWERENPLQDVCMLQMGSVCERVRLISTRLLTSYRMFWVSRCTDWIVDRYHRHWSLCLGHCRVRSPQSWQSFGKKDYIPHVHFRFRPGTRKWVKSSLIATIWAFNIRRFEGAIP